MKPIDIVKIVFEENHIDFNIRGFKTRKKEIILACQESMYMIRYFYPKYPLAEIGEIFNKKHTTVMHSVKKIGNDISIYKDYYLKIGKMIEQIRGQMGCIVTATEVMTKLTHGKLTVKKNQLSYLIDIENTEGEIKHLSISDECYNALINSYNQLNQ